MKNNWIKFDSNNLNFQENHAYILLVKYKSCGYEYEYVKYWRGRLCYPHTEKCFYLEDSSLIQYYYELDSPKNIIRDLKIIDLFDN